MNESDKKKIKLNPFHFYKENGFIVFTEEYHKARGYCCGNNCRHCVYEPKAQRGNTTIKK